MDARTAWPLRNVAGIADGVTLVRKDAHEYRPDVDGLRAVAVLAVVGFHAFPNAMPGGFVGVDIFFVISGFLISRIIMSGLSAGGFSFVDFYSRRIRRIFPATIVVLVFVLGIGWFQLLADEYKQLGEHVAGGAAFVSNFVLWGESGYFDNAANTKPLLHLWSLGIEEQFYLLWPLLLFLTWKSRLDAIWVLGAVAAASFCLNVFAVRENPVAAFYSPGMRFWELSIGAMLACITMRQHLLRWNVTQNAAHAFSALGIGLITTALLLLDSHKQFPGWWGLLPTLGAAAVIMAGPNGIFNRLLSTRVLVSIGLVSFPLYLWHWPLLTFARVLTPDRPKMILVAIAGSLLLACGTYWFVERPFRFGSRLELKAALSALAMVLVGGAGYAVYAQDGALSFRPFVLQTVMARDYDLRRFYRETGCFLADKGAEGFQDKGCFLKEFPARPVVFLIGDSYSAYLSQGLRPYLHDKRINFGQFSAAYCPPLASDNTRRCAGISDYIMREIADVRPDVALIFGRYQLYFGGMYSDLDGSQIAYEELLLKTIRRIQAAGVKRVILLGDPPSWTEDLPKLILRRFILQGKTIPERILTGLDEQYLRIDAELKKPAYAAGASYLSIADALCDGAGCRPLVGPDTRRDLVSFDTGHFTKSGADFVVQNMIGPEIERALASGN